MDLKTDYSKLEREKLEFIEKLKSDSVEFLRTRNEPEEKFKRLRHALHEAVCTTNHTDGCGYYYGKIAQESTVYHIVALQIKDFLEENEVDFDFVSQNSSLLKELFKSFR